MLAAQNAAFHTRDHRWHLSFAERLAAADPDLFCATRHVIATTADAAAEQAAIAWRQELTGVGGEGVVVKPLAQLNPRSARLVQPGLKVRGLSRNPWAPPLAVGKSRIMDNCAELK